MSEWGAGREPLDDGRSRPSRPALPPDDRPPASAPTARESGGTDLVAIAAVVIGLVGIVICGIVAAIVTGVLASVAGQRAREAGRSLEAAYLAFALAAVDGVVWLVLHVLFDIALQFG
ncbi:hypothetical protein [Jatrophihabitans endophyticus]|uniref:hypothetical protein n=1 Tax=Jatrophihabitans endophyticus TaxID=1206085 RepID=UPI0019F8C312|nr:hypothetical protein [Jatrophihabitans endophyticus]MBE7190837.1 hypothetical protein [Jatrophihabitans endophyticus]